MDDSIILGSLELAEICFLLYSLGITANCVGFFYTAYAVFLAARQPDRLLLATRWLYPYVAARYHETWQIVEHEIYLVSMTAWATRRKHLEAIARRSLPRTPSATEFISILVYAITYNRAA